VTPPRARSGQQVDPARESAPDPGTGPGTGSDPDAGSAPAAEDFTGLSYEQARDALVDVVRRLEGGAETLEESLALWERGEGLARYCERWLAGAQARLDAVRPSADD
jgi:exodeoxyribonuclease VII small subunit